MRWNDSFRVELTLLFNDCFVVLRPPSSCFTNDENLFPGNYSKNHSLCISCSVVWLYKKWIFFLNLPITWHWNLVEQVIHQHTSMISGHSNQILRLLTEQWMDAFPPHWTAGNEDSHCVFRSLCSVLIPHLFNFH